MNPPTESGLKRSHKYRFGGTELNRISLKKEKKTLFIHVKFTRHFSSSIEFILNYVWFWID